MNSLYITLKSQRYFRAITLILLGTVAGCADKDGDAVQCPECNNTTELLVGSKCVPIAQVEACGPDGHAHGSACHCFSGQQPTNIGGKDYCLQAGCGESVTDTDAQACDEAGRETENVTAVTELTKVDEAHVGLGKVVEIALPVGQESFVHFEADEATEFLVYAAATGVIDAGENEDGSALETTNHGANGDCASILPEVIGVKANSAGAVVIRLKPGTAQSVKLVIYESAHAH